MKTTPVSKIVNVTIRTSPTFPQRKGFGLLNIIGRSPRIPASERIRFYANMEGVAADFSAADEEYQAAEKFFAQAPRPVELAVARRFDVAVGAQLLGGVSIATAIAAFNTITNGGFDINVDGVNRQLAGLNFAASANLNAVAAAVQAKLAWLAPGSTVQWSGQRFIVTSGTTGTASSLQFASAPTAASAPTDVSGMLGLRAADQGYYSAGAASESITESLNAIWDKNGSWYGFTFTKEVNADDALIKQAAAWAEARVKIFGYTTAASNVQDAAIRTDIASFLQQNLYRRTIGVWDYDDDYAVVSAMARAFTVNFNEQNSMLTLKFKQLPGITPLAICESQRLALVAKNINYYSYFGDSAMLAEGVMSSGTFFDEVHGLDWLQNAIETNVLGALYTSPTKIPQTDKGVARLSQAAEKACDEAVNNGLLAPGQWNGSDLGEIKSGDFLPKGYYVYAQPVAKQNDSERQARKAPPIQVLAKGAGAIHFADVSVTFER